MTDTLIERQAEAAFVIGEEGTRHAQSEKQECRGNQAELRGQCCVVSVVSELGNRSDGS